MSLLHNINAFLAGIEAEAEEHGHKYLQGDYADKFAEKYYKDTFE